MSHAYFRTQRNSRADGEELVPLPWSGSGWGEGHMRGLAVSGALARAAEHAIAALGRPELLPTRWTLDMFRPARMRPCVASVTVVRESKRLCLVDAVLSQDDHPVARASALFLSPSESPSGAVWSGGAQPEPPPSDTPMAADQDRLYYSEGIGWGDPARAQHSGRKQVWHRAVPVVEGEQITPFQFAAGVADVMNVVSNLGANGLEFINPDVTLALVRLPRSMELGFAATDRAERDGISVGSAVVFDREGVFGTATVCGLANAQRAVDLQAFWTNGNQPRASR
ncbi:acyl-CoA thioesterase domain-containing protein [Nocardia xishanensis]